VKRSSSLIALVISVAALHQFAEGADNPSDLIVGKWKDRAEPTDAIIEFAKSGTGTITATKPEGSAQAIISWKISGTYGNGCILVIKYEAPKGKDAEALPNTATPMTWLIVFDGKDRFVTQPVANKIVFMQRQKLNSPEKSNSL
jgi:hypothetical protein